MAETGETRGESGTELDSESGGVRRLCSVGRFVIGVNRAMTTRIRRKTFTT